MYDLKNMKSAVLDDTDLHARFNKLYNDYLKEKQQPDYAFYDAAGKIDKWWVGRCITKLRKIVSIRTRLKDSEHLILWMGIKPSVVSDMVREKHYEDTLADMSNYYSRFMSIETYKQITSSVD